MYSGAKLVSLTGALAYILSACAVTTKPCSFGGDTSWPNKIHGDQHCFHKKNEAGKEVNWGRYFIKHPNGKIALEGYFVNGEKSGTWSQYNENGKLIIEKYYENGVEKAKPLPPASKDAPKT